MEKLIKLINEYGKTSNCGPFEDYRIEPAKDYNSSYLVLQRDDNGEGDWKDWFLDIPRLISKEYGFIKRLVKQNKIDDSKVGNSDMLSVQYHDLVNEYKYEGLIMILSISENPISDLCSYLK